METTKTVKVANGFVQGRVKSILGRDIVQFLSIPYCKPPVGKLRFERPQPCESFSDQIINKLDFQTCQLQTLISNLGDGFFQTVLGYILGKEEEDSLYINIWCPLDVLHGSEKQPVFVYIHGGGFFFGSSSSEGYDGSILSRQENIIVVSFNYRIGIAGFLCLDDFIKGNMGIWDQVLAMKWIYDNISAFNGDPENLTLGGFSAGAASVSLHLLIEESWSHFSKAVIQSGVCLADWACLPKKELIRRSVVCVNTILEKYKYPIEWSSNLTIDKKKSIIEYLRNISIKEYVNDFVPLLSTMQCTWVPCIDGDLIKDNPKTLFETGKFKRCPTIIQHSANEGTMLVLLRNLHIYENNQISLQDFQNDVEFYPYYPIPCDELTLEKVKSEYRISGETLSVNLYDNIMRDQHFACPSIELVEMIHHFNEKIFYVLYNTPCESIDLPKWMGVFHGADVRHLFGHYLNSKFEYKESEKEFSKYFMGQYGFFIKHGTFLQKFPYYETKSKKYIVVEKEGMVSKVLSNDQYDKVTLWKNLRKFCE